ncbi:MAG TPA: response regulator transcription factor [Thermoleophilaceae bacterium]
MATVVAGKFEDLIAKGLEVVIGDDPDLELAARDVPLPEIESVAAKHSPAVLLLNFGALSNPVEVQSLAQRLPEVRIVVLAHRPTAAECTQMLAFGATGCLSKETQARDVVNAIHLASRGMHVLPRSAAAGGGVDRLGMEGTELTARESEVLELLQDGYTNSEIAETLSIGVETVRTHARSIYRKLGVPSRRELARRAQQEPVVVDDERRPVPAGG